MALVRVPDSQYLFESSIIFDSFGDGDIRCFIYFVHINNSVFAESSVKIADRQVFAGRARQVVGLVLVLNLVLGLVLNLVLGLVLSLVLNWVVGLVLALNFVPHAHANNQQCRTARMMR